MDARRAMIATTIMISTSVKPRVFFDVIFFIGMIFIASSLESRSRACLTRQRPVFSCSEIRYKELLGQLSPLLHPTARFQVQPGRIFELELFFNAGPVGIDSGQADMQLSANFAGGPTESNQLENLKFAVG